MSTERIHLQDEKIKGGGYLTVIPLIMASAGPQGQPGETGIQGQTGIYVPSGVPGATGIEGLQGQTGIDGLTGDSGAQGGTGVQGKTGLVGLQGGTGIRGLQGIQGPQGATGIQGIDGQTGVQGIQGDKGSTGIQGVTGLIGQTGIQGIVGNKGATGIQGLGLQGDTGIQGDQGATGIEGLGSRGETGIQGQTGLLGQTGIQGKTGLTGPGMNVIIAQQIPVSNGTSYQYGGLSYDGTTMLTSANIFAGQLVNAGQFIQQASTYVTDATWNNGWRNTVAWSPTGAMEYLEWAHFTGFANWEDYVLRIRSDNNVQINNTLLLTDNTGTAYIGMASTVGALTGDSVVNDTVIRAAATGGGANHFKILFTADHGNSTGLAIKSPTNGQHLVGINGVPNPQFGLDVKGYAYTVSLSGNNGPGMPSNPGIVIWFDGTDVKATRSGDGKTSVLSTSWA